MSMTRSGNDPGMIDRPLAVIDIAWACWEAVRAFGAFLGEDPLPCWTDATQEQRCRVIESVTFLLARPDAGPATKLRPYLVPFGSWPRGQQSKDILFHGLVNLLRPYSEAAQELAVPTPFHLIDLLRSLRATTLTIEALRTDRTRRTGSRGRNNFRIELADCGGAVVDLTIDPDVARALGEWIAAGNLTALAGVQVVGVA